ncbi:hypothetical protein DL770_002020 [Monosporascus sp. CRB-9-2]|nr:hypothetical protein DL770_002020 [Monosporascus sp. CRB-9-2]
MLQVPSPGRTLFLPLCFNAVRSQSGGVVLVAARNVTDFGTAASRPRRRRTIHSSSTQKGPAADSHYIVAASQSSAMVPTSAPVTAATPTEPSRALVLKKSPLSVLPLPTILRTLFSSAISSSPILLPPSLKIMSVMAHTDSTALNPDRNPLLRYFLKKTFYSQFCAGENAAEVRRTVSALKNIGFDGVLIGYAREVVLTEAQQRALSACDEGEVAEECFRNEIEPWKAGNLETLKVAQAGDFVSVKFTGAGRQALWALKNRLPPPPRLAAAIDEICALAREKDVPLLIDAEQTAVQAGIDDWTMLYMKKYNTRPGHALIYGTYQAYLKSTPATLAAHLEAAAREGFTLGVKLVRGAYIGSDPRHIIHDTKEDTDAAYDSIASSLIRRRWGPVLRPRSSANTTTANQQQQQQPEFPLVSVLLGTHNLESVRKAHALRAGDESADTELAVAQLMGMADDVSCDLLAANRALQAEAGAQRQGAATEDAKKGEYGSKSKAPVATRAYKYVVWGSTKECMAYLLRRAQENKDAVSRTKAARDAMWEELKRRIKGAFGFGPAA